MSGHRHVKSPRNRILGGTAGLASRLMGKPANNGLASLNADIVTGHDFIMGAVTGTRIRARVGCTGLCPVTELVEELKRHDVAVVSRTEAPGPFDLGGSVLEIDAPPMSESALRTLINTAKAAVIPPHWPTSSPGGTQCQQTQ